MRAFFPLFLLVLSAFTSSAQASPDLDFPQPAIALSSSTFWAGPTNANNFLREIEGPEPFQILNRSGVMDGQFEWFQVRDMNGQFGYIWGRDLCTLKPFPGIGRACNDWEIQEARLKAGTHLGQVQQPQAQQPQVQQPQAQQPQVNQAPWNTAQINATGFDVVVVNYEGGGFARYNNNGQWTEYDNLGNPKFNYQQTANDRVSVTLYDASRNVTIKLDLLQRMIFYADSNQPLRNLYDITYASR